MVTQLTVSDVEHIAELAKLGLTEEEKRVFCEQLSAILEHFEKLQGVDTSAIPPTATVLPLRNVMRQDEVRPSLSPEEFLSNAPDREGDSVRVCAVLR
jgi:aspartyl-tRNA(Asn)/glutamyl-tRNA(Gln) amidotransferase subunit C